MFSVLFSGEDVWGAGSGPCGVTHLLSSPPCGERTRRAGGAEAGGHRLGGVPQPPRERKRALPRGLAGALEEEAQVGLLTLARCGPVLRLVLGRPEGEGGGGGQGQHRCAPGVVVSGAASLGPWKFLTSTPRTCPAHPQGSQQAARVGMGSVTWTGLELSPRPPPHIATQLTQ